MELTIEDLKALVHPPQPEPVPLAEGDFAGPWKIGAPYIIRTVTMTLTGELEAVHDQELVLNKAAWIADSGRWADALKTGEFDEVEPFPNPIIVGRGAIIDATMLNSSTHLPTEQK